MTLKNIHIHVDWNDSPLYDEDNEGSTVYDSDVEYRLGWNVPAFAPDGHYDVHITGTGDTDSVKDGKVLCIRAQMDLWNLKTSCFLKVLRNAHNDFKYFN